MVITFKKIVYKHAYLLIIAAWLYTFSFIVTNYWSYNSSPQKVAGNIQLHLHEQEKSFTEITSDTSTINDLLNQGSNKQTQLFQEKFGVFVYVNNDRENPIPVYWNNTKYSVDTKDVLRDDGNYFIKYSNGYFELIKKTIVKDNKTIIVVAVLPVKWEYFITNRYLKQEFENYPGLEQQYKISDDVNALPVKTIEGKTLFYIEKINENTDAGYDVVTLICRTLSIILLFLFLNAAASEMIAVKGFEASFTILMAAVLVFRLLMYFTSFPFDKQQLELFDPVVYASSAIHPSLGDLLINAILFYWLVSFYKFNSTRTKFIINASINKIIPYLNLIVLVFAAFFFSYIIRSLITDSKISFDVTNFFSLTIYSFLGFIILCLVILSFLRLSHILLKKIIDNTGLLTQLIVVAITGLLFLSITINNQYTVSNIFVLSWLLLYLIIINYRKQDIYIALHKSSFFIFWVIFSALSIVCLVIEEENVLEQVQRKEIAERLANDDEPSGKNMLLETTKNINDEFLNNNAARFENEQLNKQIKDSILSKSFSGHMNKYKARIYTFDSLFHPLYNEDSLSYATIKTIILNKAVKTIDNKDLYTYPNRLSKINYVYEKQVLKNNSTAGYFFVLIEPREYKSDALYPELFKQADDFFYDVSANYAYAIYKQGKLVNSFSDYNFPNDLKEQNSVSTNYRASNNNNYSQLLYNTGDGKQIIIVKRNTLVLEFVTLFAYLFCSILLIVAAFQLINFLIKARFKWQYIKAAFQFNLRTQIHFVIIFISVFSFLIIGIATISFFVNRFNENNKERLSRSIQVMVNEIKSSGNGELRLDSLSQNELISGSDIEKKIMEISQTHDVDVNYFNRNGNLEISTQPYIYSKHLLNDKMNPLALLELQQQKNIQSFKKEEIGKLSFLSIYIPLLDDAGNIEAYLNIPYLNSQAELKQEISRFIVTIINLNAFIFLIAGAIAFIITNRITASFSLIGDKMKEINLGTINEAIEWKRNDEIGVLVNEYNKMLDKLEQSAKALATSEREGAWREMAKQVAHEIKNPLTPMKLSIQYLQNAIANNSTNVKELSKQVAETLVEQIDQLAKIAGDFSQFANINNSKEEKFDITETIESLLLLYKTDANVKINYKRKEGSYLILADKIQMNRLFTNLLKNATEASAQKQIHILITQQIIGKNILITIADNGTGIAKEIQPKIFTPNFTTKSSGTGLGLAICKNIVENANGSIWFETKENEGTTFFVQLPIAE